MLRAKVVFKELKDMYSYPEKKDNKVNGRLTTLVEKM